MYVVEILITYVVTYCYKCDILLHTWKKITTYYYVATYVVVTVDHINILGHTYDCDKY